MENPNSNAQAIIDAITDLHGAKLCEVTDERAGSRSVRLMQRPAGVRLESIKPLLDEYLPHPERRTGATTLYDQATFALFVQRFLTARQTVCFADPSPTAPKLTAIFDYHESATVQDGVPGFSQHRATLDCRLSDEWKAWLKVNGETMSQLDFAAFLEDRIGDVVLVNNERTQELATMLSARVGGPSALMTLARGLSVNVTGKVQQALTLETGEISIRYEEVHSDGTGKPITTPNLFFIAIPVFYGGAPYQIPVRIRYRIANGGIVWSAHLYRPDKAFEDAFKAIVEFVGEATGAPMFTGVPDRR